MMSRLVLAGALVALAGACDNTALPDLEVRNSLGYVNFDLTAQGSGYRWSDDSSSGIITRDGSILTELGGQGGSSLDRCGPSGASLCRATLNGGRIDIVIPDASSLQPQSYGLQRSAGTVVLDDGAGGMLLSLQPTGDGNATIYGRPGGALIGTTQKEAGGIAVLNWDGAYVGAVDGNAPPEIAALALGPALDSSGGPHLPDLPIVVASAVIWLR